MNISGIRNIIIYVLSICCILLPLSAWAEKLSREELLFIDIPIVVTASKATQKLVDAPATVVVISETQIVERGYSNLLDLIQDLPDVDFRNKSGEESYNEITIRGNAGQEKFIIMMDGFRISSPTNEKIPVAENFPLYNAKQVEVVYGPASALYGADAFTGVINIITKDAMALDGVDLVVSAGSFGYENHYINYGGRILENVKLSLGGHWHEADNADLSKYYDEYDMNVPLVTFGGYTAARANEREDFYGETRSYTGYAKLVFDDSFILGYNESYFRHPTTSGVKPDWSYFGPDARWETLIKNYYGQYKSDSSKKTIGKTSISYLTYEVLPDSKYRNRYVDFEDSHKYAHSKKFMIEQQIDHKMEEHTVIGGASFESFYALPKTYDLLWRKYDPDQPASEQQYYYGGTNNTLPAKIFELNYENYGSYLQAQSQWSDVLSSTLGVRYDYNSRYGETTNPRGGVVIKPKDETTIKVLYGEAYLAPSPYSAYAYHFGVFNSYSSATDTYYSSFMSIPNPELKPEKSKTGEITLLQGFKDISFELTAYYTEVNNIVFPVYHSTPSNYIEGGVINAWQRNENVGDATFYGGHFSFDYKKDFGAIDLKWWGNYSYVDGHVDEGDGVKKDPFYIARHKVKSGFTLNYDRYFVSPTIRWIDVTNSRWIDRNDTKRQTVPAHTIVDIHMGSEILSNRLSVLINVKNLLDERYYNPGGGSANFERAPQEPRKVVLMLKYKL